MPVCRLCASEKPIAITLADGIDLSFQEILEYHTRVDLDSDSELPQGVCLPCKTVVADFAEFSYLLGERQKLFVKKEPKTDKAEEPESKKLKLEEKTVEQDRDEVIGHPPVLASKTGAERSLASIAEETELSQDPLLMMMASKPDKIIHEKEVSKTDGDSLKSPRASLRKRRMSVVHSKSINNNLFDEICTVRKFASIFSIFYLTFPILDNFIQARKC